MADDVWEIEDIFHILQGRVLTESQAKRLIEMVQSRVRPPAPPHRPSEGMAAERHFPIEQLSIDDSTMGDKPLKTWNFMER